MKESAYSDHLHHISVHIQLDFTNLDTLEGVQRTEVITMWNFNIKSMLFVQKG